MGTALSLTRQCEIIGLNRSSYYRPRPMDQINSLLMKLIDEQYKGDAFLRYAEDDVG
jgi:hypothetical protein